jgi:hypothetical protein
MWQSILSYKFQYNVMICLKTLSCLCILRIACNNFEKTISHSELTGHGCGHAPVFPLSHRPVAKKTECLNVVWVTSSISWVFNFIAGCIEAIVVKCLKTKVSEGMISVGKL